MLKNVSEAAGEKHVGLKNRSFSAVMVIQALIQRSATAKIRPFIVVMVLGFGALFAMPTFAWSEFGHLAVAELAVRTLDAKSREQLDTWALPLRERDGRLEYLERRYSVSTLAATAAWADTIRDEPVEALFSRLPPALRAYHGQTTDGWHYSNVLYYDEPGEREVYEQECKLTPGGHLTEVIPALRTAFGQTDQGEDRAVVLALLIHFIGDAHQPLHTVTRATSHCRHDRGGNGFCASGTNSSGRCAVNLHRLWDSGLGLFDRGDPASLLSDLSSAVSDGNQAIIVDPLQWQAENFRHATGIYAISPGQAPPEGYLRWGRHVVRERVNLAQRRLAAVLTDLVQQD